MDGDTERVRVKYDMKYTGNPTGITVGDLKRLLADWPETRPDGEPTEVWVETGIGLSGPCIEAIPLNCRLRDDGTASADLMLRPSDEAWNHVRELFRKV